MLPLLNLGDGSAGSSRQGRVLPPPGFTPARRVESAGLLDQTIGSGRCHTARQREGIRYEQKVLDALVDIFPLACLPSPWLFFYDRGHYRRCQPDALLFFPRRVTIVEVKLTHCAKAWWQLRRLYEPVVAKVFPSRRVELVEIATAFDPAVATPEPFTIMKELDEIRNQAGSAVRCLSWKL